jgi:hypothetical protein
MLKGDVSYQKNPDLMFLVEYICQRLVLCGWDIVNYRISSCWIKTMHKTHWACIRDSVCDMSRDITYSLAKSYILRERREWLSSRSNIELSFLAIMCFMKYSADSRKSLCCNPPWLINGIRLSLKCKQFSEWSGINETWVHWDVIMSLHYSSPYLKVIKKKHAFLYYYSSCSLSLLKGATF